MRRVSIGVFAAIVAAAVGPACALATWSPARTFDAANTGSARPAVNARGDAVVLWTSRSPSRLRVTLLPAGGKRGGRVLAGGTAVTGSGPKFQSIVLDERGGATVVWVSAGKLYAVHGSVSGGKWSAPQLIARGGAWLPALDVSRDRTVLLAWIDSSGDGATRVAWRATGERFSSAKVMKRPAPGFLPGGPQGGVGVSFDALGRAYVWGSCDGVVRMTKPRARQMKLVILTSKPALGFSFAVTGSGRGLASWVDSRCTTDAAAGPAPGLMRVRPLQSGSFGHSRFLTTGPGQPTPLLGGGTSAIALAGDGSLVTASTTNPSGGGGMSVFTLSAQAALRAVTPATFARLPFAADGGGNLLLSTANVGYTVQPRRGDEQPFDKGGSGPEAPAIGATAAVVAHGRGFGVVWDPDLTFVDHRGESPRRRLSVSLWK